MQIVDQIRDKLEKESVSVLKMSNETGISAYKIYKWLDGKGNPKADDALIIKKWLSGNLDKVQNSNNGIDQAPTLPGSVTLQDHIDLLKKQAATAEADKDKLFINNETLARALDKLGSIYEMFITNSNVTKEQLDAIVDQVRAEHAVMMDALDRLEKNEAGTSAMKAGSLEIDRKKSRKGKQVGAGK